MSVGRIARRHLKALQEIKVYFRNRKAYRKRLHSPHEGWAKMLEEVDELWEEVRRKSALRSKAAMRAEAKQVAAIAIRFMGDLCE